MTAPTTFNGKNKVFEETFVSPFQRETEGDALRVLDAIRSSHPSFYGWVEFAGYAEQLPNGKWRAVRHHAKYE